jgi:SAM-dependent methyltransferase
MTENDKRAHWEQVYGGKSETEVSWFQETPAPSLDLLRLTGAGRTSAIVDIGGGAARLIDALLDLGFENVTALDISEAALAAARARIGARADRVKWIVADITQWSPAESYDVWHDRAAFHFLIEPDDQAAYRLRLGQALKRGGHAIIGTFAPDGPEECSGLPVTRWNAEALATFLGPEFALVDSRAHDHVTPWRAVQKFQFSTFRRLA